MAVRTYIPGILAVANYLKKYLNEHSTTLQERMGNGLYSLLVLVVDLAVILASIISANEPAADEPWTDFTEVNTLSSTQINQITAAWDKFLTTNGLGA
jgi:hypothetical protein